MNIEQYLQWRQDWLKSPVGHNLLSHRGECIVGKRFIIEDKVRQDFHLKNRALEDAEFNLLFFGKDMDQAMKDRLYENDYDLYEAYKSLRVERLKLKRRTSRKNIVFNSECCLCFWHLYRDTLTVMSRSWDIKTAGLSDLVIINRAALELDCDRIQVITLNNHVYKDTTKVARRTNAPISI